MNKKNDSEEQWPRATLVLLGLLTLSLYFLQYWTLPQYSKLSLNIISFEVFWQVVTHVIQPGWEDAVWFSLPALFFAAIVGLEIRRREFTSLLVLCFGSARASWLLLVGLVPFALALVGMVLPWRLPAPPNWTCASAPAATHAWPIPISRLWKFASTTAW